MESHSYEIDTGRRGEEVFMYVGGSLPQRCTEFDARRPCSTRVHPNVRTPSPHHMSGQGQLLSHNAAHNLSSSPLQDQQQSVLSSTLRDRQTPESGSLVPYTQDLPHVGSFPDDSVLTADSVASSLQLPLLATEVAETASRLTLGNVTLPSVTLSHPPPNDSAYLQLALDGSSQMAVQPVGQLHSVGTTSPNPSIPSLSSMTNLVDGSYAMQSFQSAQLAQNSGTMVPASTTGMRTPPPSAPAQFLPMPPTHQNTWPSTWPSSVSAPPPPPSNNHMLPTQYACAAAFQQAGLPTHGPQPPRLEPAFPAMQQAQARRLAMDGQAAAFAASHYPTGVYHYQAPSAKRPCNETPYRMEHVHLPINKVRGDGRKCRKVYGMENRGEWCTQCRWKKACVRFTD